MGEGEGGTKGTREQRVLKGGVEGGNSSEQQWVSTEHPNYLQ